MAAAALLLTWRCDGGGGQRAASWRLINRSCDAMHPASHLPTHGFGSDRDVYIALPGGARYASSYFLAGRPSRVLPPAAPT